MSKSELLTLFNLKRYFYSIIINQFNQNNRKSYFLISIIHLENELTDTMKFCMQYKSDIFLAWLKETNEQQQQLSPIDQLVAQMIMFCSVA